MVGTHLQADRISGETVLPYEHWTVSDTLMVGGPEGSFDDVAAKDPAIVFFDNNYHLFYTTKLRRETAKKHNYVGPQRAGLGYVTAPTLEGLHSAVRHDMNEVLGQVVIAPQIFFFEPQKMWYLIAQIPTPNDRPNLRPVFATNPDIRNVSGWSNIQEIPTSKANDDFWIDFWVICDENKAHLFYTDHRGSMFRMETPLGSFPDFSGSIDETVLTVRGENEKGRWRMHEASHIYYVASAKKYLCLLEAAYPHPTRSNYWDSRSRFMIAMLADKLEGPWMRAEKGWEEFAGDPDQLYLPNGERAKYDQVSHFEIVRPSYDQHFEIPDLNFVLLFQGFDAKQTPDNFIYDDLPWELALMRNYDGPWEVRLPSLSEKISVE